MNKVIFNSSYGGFSLSKEAAEWLVEHGSDKIRTCSVPELNDTFIEWNGTRHDPLLVQCIEELKDKANGKYARLEIATIKGNKYMIYEYDGLEEIIDPETYKWIVVDGSEDGAGDALKAALDKIKAKYGYDKPFLYIDLLDTINELFKDEQKAV